MSPCTAREMEKRVRRPAPTDYRTETEMRKRQRTYGPRGERLGQNRQRGRVPSYTHSPFEYLSAFPLVPEKTAHLAATEHRNNIITTTTTTIILLAREEAMTPSFRG